MAQPGFIFGGNTGMSYDQVQKQRDIANELLRANMNTPQNVGEGLSAIGRALAAKAIDKRASRADETNRKAYEAERDRAFQALGGFGGTGGGSAGYSPSGTWTPAPPPPKPTDSFMGNPDTVFSGGNSFNMPAPADAAQPSAPLSFGSAVMTPQEMLIAGAEARGLNPIDVATAISYETGGKFDPLIKGPTTQWGQHEGLIQFGDPQGQEHGAVFDQGADAAWRSQLNPNTGAVWSYLDSTGVQPGMGLDQIYSAINAGGVNRFGASDANNGGAPGTVADKVAGMGPHRENAAKFLGGTWTPTEGQAGAAPQPAVGAPAGGMGSPAIIMALAGIQGNPYASDSDKAIANILIEQTIQSMDPMRQMEMERARLELDALKNPQPQPGFQMLTDEQEAQMGLNPAGVYQQGPDGALKVVQDAPKGSPRPMTAEERAAWGIAPEDTTPYAIGEDGMPKPIGGGGVTVNNDLGGGKFDDEFAKGDAASLVAVSDAGNAAIRNLGRIDQLEGLLAASPTGAGAALAQAAGEFGINTEGLDEIQSAQAIINSLVPEQRQPGSGPMSDADLALFKQSLPRIINQPGGNQTIIQTMRAIAQYDAEGAQIVQQLRAGEIKRAEAFDRLQARKNPLEGFKAPANGDPAPKPAAGAVPEGIEPELWDVMTDEERALFQ